MFYFSSTYVGWEGQLFVQKSGVCIGASVAPVPSDIFLSTLDRILDRELEGLHEKVHRHVDDYLIFTQKHVFQDSRHRILEVFQKNGCGLFFTSKVPVNGQIQFLD